MIICLIVGCSKCSGRDKDVSFYRIPKITMNNPRIEELSRRRREGFIAAISRSDLTDSILESNRICSRHFITGKPAELEDELHPDWLPTQNLDPGSETDPVRSMAKVERYERRLSRIARSERIEAAETLLNFASQRSLHAKENEVQSDDSAADMMSIGVQTDLTRVDNLLFHDELLQSKKKIDDLEDRLSMSCAIFTIDSVLQESESSKKFIQFYTGLPNAQLLRTIFEFVVPADSSKIAKLSHFQEFMMTLIKLRLNSPMQDLAFRFGVSCSTVFRILHKWLTIMDIKLRPLIMWPDRENLRQTMPDCFRISFGEKVAVVINCFEVFIDRPSSLLARAATWSSYKHHNTTKFLIGITPQGVVSFISCAWGGRVSDKYLTEHCGILYNLLPGDIVLADRGFDISDSVGMHQARLHLPAFTRGKDQLSAIEVEETRSIANVRIHVERVIGNVRRKYAILNGTLPINFLTLRDGEERPLIDKIVRVSCALCNVCDSVVPFD